MMLSVRSVQESDNISEVVREINITNNEMTQNFNALLSTLSKREKEIDALRAQVESLSNKLGDFAVSTPRENVNKKSKAKNMRLGFTEETTVNPSTLYQTDAGELKWKNKDGTITPIAP